MKKKNINKILHSHINEITKIAVETKQKTNEIFKISIFLIKKIKNKKKIFVYGNGGSYSDSTHFVAELVSNYKNIKRKPLPILMLSSNIASTTAWANDYQYETFLIRELKAISERGDVLILVSTSGGNTKKKQSINLIKVAEYAKKNSIDVILFSGNKGGELKKYSKLNFITNSNNTPIIQENQKMIFHLISEIMDNVF